MKSHTLSAVLFITTTALASACGTTPDAKGGGANGTVFYSSASGDIWQLSLASGEQHQLFQGSDPERTPEGTMIYHRSNLFESTDGVAPHAVVKAGGGAPDNQGFVAPRLSGDGTRVAYITSGHDVVYVVNRADGALVSGFPVHSATLGFDRVSWTPDGRLVVAKTGSATGLYVSDAALTTWTRFDPNLDEPRSPTVSPDGKLVAFILNKHVFTMHLDGTEVKQLTTGDAAEFMPAFSPDSASVAAYREFPLTSTLIVVPAAGGAVNDVGAIHPELALHMWTVDQFCWR